MLYNVVYTYYNSIFKSQQNVSAFNVKMAEIAFYITQLDALAEITIVAVTVVAQQEVK